MSENNTNPHRILIVGGGAGGLELASKLGRKSQKKRNKRFEVTLLDASPTHIWKPLYHEVAAGSLDIAEQVEYLAHARLCHFNFRLGKMDGLDRNKQEVYVKATCNEVGEELIPRRTLTYDTLVIAVGSVHNTFGIKGVEEHCLFLDTEQQALRFQKHLLESYIKASFAETTADKRRLSIAIIGAGATGVELSAELHDVTDEWTAYHMDDEMLKHRVELTIIDASDRLLSALPERLANATAEQLQALGIQLKMKRRIVEVTADGVKTEGDEFFAADLIVWSAGIKAPDWLDQLDGLESNRIHQLVVKPTLQTTRDDRIFVIGDCAACPWQGREINVPPRAQTAHQQSDLLVRSIIDQLDGRETLPPYRYRDYGSLITLGEYTVVGNLMGNLMGSVSVGGFIARLFYLSLYKMHQVALFGYFRVGLLTVANLFRRSTKAHIKLH